MQQRRRDKGKVAQRNFRKRQAEKALELKQNHKQLRHLVETVVLAHRDGDTATLSQAIAQAGRAIGVGLDGDRMDRVDERAQSDPSHTSMEGVVTGISNIIRPVCAATTEYSVEPTVTDRDTGQSLLQLSQPRSGRFSPRLDYGIWLDPERFLKIVDPPLDIRPYIGARKHTVAGRIAWAALDYGYACLQEAMMTSQPATTFTASTATGARKSKADWLTLLPPESAGRRAFDRSLRHSTPLHDVAYMMDLVAARIEFRQQGYMRANTRGADEIARQAMAGSVAAELRVRGVRMDQWWSALDIEAHVQTEMGVWDFAAWQMALCGGNQETNNSHAELIMPLVESLGHSGVCFGDGPRWHVPRVKALVRAWWSQVSRLELP
ncbi:hypothetical protein AYO21_07338 [Fonsecaea monophora]|uniref:BZIP domain-containing protein n=1 Tax=Fonsecaea monophora TaxID=254056 RepID=A0A177F3X0_9EURO|nr:hypothetical protein AYO21_07338 [Fonsecaea monophora]OAG38516.1 hypothetical protein AYO21_07338 [Fonsecaea monophora]